MTYIIGTDQFRSALDSWLLKSDQRSAQYLEQNKSGIPDYFRRYNQTLFRGMVVDEKFLDSLTKGTARLDGISSWSKDQKIAEAFLEEGKFKFTKNQGTKVLLKKKFLPQNQILDIESFVLYMGVQQLIFLGYDEVNLDSAIKEKEVLITKGVRIGKTEFSIIN